jgi:hypothetical protein
MPLGGAAMSNRRNVVLYLDQELVEKSRELGFRKSLKTACNTTLKESKYTESIPSRRNKK